MKDKMNTPFMMTANGITEPATRCRICTGDPGWILRSRNIPCNECRSPIGLGTGEDGKVAARRFLFDSNNPTRWRILPVTATNGNGKHCPQCVGHGCAQCSKLGIVPI